MTAMLRCVADISWKRFVADAAAALHGWIVLDKPLGLGSTQAVSAIKRALRTAGHAKAKVGHGGTLDPLATGVLPIAIGEATKLAGRMLDASKIYDFTISFGTQTDSLDLEGAVIATSDVRPSQAQIEAILPRFTGPIHQIPPAYSALKVGGKRAYDLGTVGHVSMLRRVKAGPFTLEGAISLDILDEHATARSLGDLVLPLRTALDDIPALALEAGQALALRQGRVLSGVAASNGLHLALLADVPVALVDVLDGTVTVERGFNL